jgi:hypothetical protein
VRNSRVTSNATGWHKWWLEAATIAAVVVVAIVCLAGAWPAPQELAPLLAVPPALAGIGATTSRRPLAYGVVGVVAAVIILAVVHDALTAASLVAVAVVTALSVVATSGSAPKTQQMQNVISVAETAQRALLRPLPEQLGPLELGVVYLAAAADAKVGGDLYEVMTTEHGIRLIIGDVRGKGLGAVEVAADVLGMFREIAHEVHTLAELARRLDAGLSRRWGEHEEFVTALLAEIDPQAGRLTIYSCGHPPPILISGASGSGDSVSGDSVSGEAAAVEVLEVPVPSPPLGMLTLGDGSGAGRTLAFQPHDQLLLYTDGVTEARDQRRVFYPLPERVAELAGVAARDAASGPGGDMALLGLIRDDLLRYVGTPLDDDAALVLVRAPAAWLKPSRAARRASAAGASAAGASAAEGGAAGDPATITGT